MEGSFRDPSGFVFCVDGSIYRQVNEVYKENYDQLMASGLYNNLVEADLLVAHEETSEVASPSPQGAYKLIKPRMIPFVSYPYEWCFSQLKDAALATLAIQKTALKFGMTLKDCSAYNIQFCGAKPVFIDTLSFEKYVEGMPWTPYKQFCQHFLAPLALMSCVDIRLNGLLQSNIDGIPLDLASSLLPKSSRLSFPLLLHIHLHAKSQNRYSDEVIERKKFTQKVSKTALLGLIESLESAVKKYTWKPAGTEWAEYYSDDSYIPSAFEHKQSIVKDYLSLAKPRVAWDMGANNGFFSRLANDAGAYTVAFDVDPACVEMNYLQGKKSGEAGMLALLLDLTNPSANRGWANDERMSVLDRSSDDTAMALALIHHLAISNNVPLVKIAQFFGSICRSLIIEFVPKSDHKVKKLLGTREDVFPSYTKEGFEEAFSSVFTIERCDPINDSERTMYLMTRKS